MTCICDVGHIIKKQNGQYAVVCRCKVLGCTDAYIVCCFDGPDETYGCKCAVIGAEFKENWQEAEPNITGTIDITSGTTQVNGTNTMFTTQLTNGDKIILGMKQGTIEQVVNDTTLTLTESYNGNTLSNSNMWKL